MYVLLLCVCVGLMLLHTEDRHRPLYHGLFPPLCGIIRRTVVSSDGGLHSSLAHITDRERERERVCVCMTSVCPCTCAYVYLCVFEFYSNLAMSHTVWGLQCICAQHDKCVPLDSISSLQPHSIWCQLCTL